MKLISLCLLAVTLGLSAAETGVEPGTFLDASSAGQDYLDQGEYRNDWGGAQVIALGRDRFRMITFQGGLPGDGWNGESRRENNGQRDGDKIVFTGENGYRAELAKGTITITTDTGGPYRMDKIERKGPTLGAKPPPGAVVLFDGSSVEAWEGGHFDDRHLLAAGCKSRQRFQDFTLHLEFLLPFKPLGRGQDRGNSGVYLQDRYEIQVLDSFGLKGEDSECGGIYGQARPAVNMCFPPLTWQTYDVEFTAARFGPDGAKLRNATATIRHNGVVIHDRVEFKGPTGGGQPENSSPGPLQLQGHGNPVFYRNIWVLPK